MADEIKTIKQASGTKLKKNRRKKLIHDIDWVDPEIEEVVLSLAIEFPVCGELWISYVLKERGVLISSKKVSLILLRHNISPYDIILDTIIEITKPGKHVPTDAPSTSHLKDKQADFIPPNRYDIAWEIYGVMMGTFEDIQLNWLAAWFERMDRQKKG
jgi:hypothetical protein